MEKKEAILNFVVICIIGIGWQLWSSRSTTKNNDAPSLTYLSQWKIWILWGNLFLFIIASFWIIIYFVTRRQKQTQQQEEKEQDDKIKEEDEDEDFFPPKIKIEPESNEQQHEIIPNILSLEQMQHISKLALPPTISSSSYFTKWKRLYCLARDGDAFLTFLHKVQNDQRTLLVVKTTKGEIFGGYADSAWEVSHTNGQWGGGYYGSAQACLFRVVKQQGDSTNTAHDDDDENDAAEVAKKTLKSKQEKDIIASTIKVYKWTGINRYIQLCNAQRKIIAFGGGNSSSSTTSASSPSFGLILENDFQRGSTSYCDTFGNEPLCGDGGEESFSILDMECWGFSTCLDVS